MIICSLLDGEITVAEFNEAGPLSQSALSQHLAIFREPELVARCCGSQAIYYKRASDDVKTMLHTLDHMFCEN